MYQGSLINIKLVLLGHLDNVNDGGNPFTVIMLFQNKSFQLIKINKPAIRTMPCKHGEIYTIHAQAELVNFNYHSQYM